jgi:DNA-binding MarR family transcriptional regulator
VGEEDDAYDELVKSWGGWPNPGPDPASLQADLRKRVEHFVAPSTRAPSGRRKNVGGAEAANALWKATTQFIEMSDGELAKFHLTMERLIVLREIATARAPLDMKSLARRLSVTAGTMSVLVKRLMRDGHVEQCPDTFDRRARIVKATIKGTYVAALASAVVAGGTNRLMGRLSGRDKKALVTALERMTAPPDEGPTLRAST